MNQQLVAVQSKDTWTLPLTTIDSVYQNNIFTTEKLTTMTNTLDCKIYYSMIGESFNIYERLTDKNVWATKAIIKMNVNKLELVPACYENEEHEPEFDTFTDIEFTHDVKGGAYFASDTKIIIVNGKNQILKLDGKYRFDVKMYRNLDNPNQFTIIMKNKKFSSEPQWICL